MEKLKNKGITLVALVITIIILLILAGITISQLTGSGLFENAKLAEEKSKNAREKEEIMLSEYSNAINNYGKVENTRYTDDEIDNKMAWKFLGSQQGTTPISLQNISFNELYIKVHVYIPNHNGVYFDYLIPYIALEDETESHRNAYVDNPAVMQGSEIYISKTECKLGWASYYDPNGRTNVTNNSTIYVYYR